MAEILVSDLRDDRPPLMHRNTTPKDRRRQWALVHRVRPAALADPVPAAAMRKSEKPGSL
jgi:hypothetical protein